MSLSAQASFLAKRNTGSSAQDKFSKMSGFLTDAEIEAIAQEEISARDVSRKKKKQEEVLKRKGRSSSIITGTGGVSDDALGLVGRPKARSSILLG